MLLSFFFPLRTTFSRRTAFVKERKKVAAVDGRDDGLRHRDKAKQADNVGVESEGVHRSHFLLEMALVVGIAKVRIAWHELDRDLMVL